MLVHKVNISVISQGIEFDNSPMSNSLIRLFAVLAELERTFTSDRIKSWLAVARQKGVKLGAPTKKRDNALKSNGGQQPVYQ